MDGWWVGRWAMNRWVGGLVVIEGVMYVWMDGGWVGGLMLGG